MTDSPEGAGPKFTRGAYVRFWFDTGSGGMAPLYGRVVSAGPKRAEVAWESGNRNRLRQDGEGPGWDSEIVPLDKVPTDTLARLAELAP